MTRTLADRVGGHTLSDRGCRSPVALKLVDRAESARGPWPCGTTGAMAGRVALPPGSTLYEAGADHVLVEEVDALGVERVRAYRLETGG